MIRKHVVRAVLRRNFSAYFSSPTGYVFITVFIVLSSALAFCQDAFFTANLANLDTLNRFFPFLLLFFVPAIAMGAWAEERKQGTDELLLTLPARDLELVLGKYLAALGVYSVALLFSMTHLLVLRALGRPDLGVMLGTYAGYWFLGAALLSVAMVASLLTTSMTVAFILGALFCAVPVTMGQAEAILGGRLERWVTNVGVAEPFRDFTSGILSLEGVVYFAALTAVMLYVNLVLLSRRHVTQEGEWAHRVTRAVLLVVAAVSLGILTHRLHWTADLTSERLHTLTQQTRETLGKIDAAKPVFVQAFVSPEVPSDYVQTRENLLLILRRMSAMAGERLQLRVVEATPFSEAARDAEKFNIRPERVRETEEGRQGTRSVYLGVAFTCGAEEAVVPFLYRGLSVEYELTRSLGVVIGARRRKIGVAATDAKIFGGFEFEAMSNQPPWSIVDELKKQYDVASVTLDQEVKESYEVLVVPMPSSLTQPQMDNLLAYVRKGRPTLLLDDPLPLFNPGLGPREPRRGPGGRGGMFGQAPPGEPKGDLGKLMAGIGVSWPEDDVVWDSYKPPLFREEEKEILFAGPAGGNARAFNPDDTISSGLQNMVFLCTGHLRPRTDLPLAFTPLVSTTLQSGVVLSSQALQRDMFGRIAGFNPMRVHRFGGREYTLAARIQGTLPAEPPRDGGAAAPPEPAKVDVIVVADLDFVAEQFFRLRRQGIQDLNFDNITFLLNCVDMLAGDASYVALRKRRPAHRTLETVERRSKVHQEDQVKDAERAEDEAKSQGARAQEEFDRKVEEVRKRSDLDARMKEITVLNIQEMEQRRLDAAKARIEDEKNTRIDRSRSQMTAAVRGIQKNIKVFAVLLPPILPFGIALAVFWVRLSRERQRPIETPAAPERSSP